MMYILATYVKQLKETWASLVEYLFAVDVTMVTDLGIRNKIDQEV